MLGDIEKSKKIKKNTINLIISYSEYTQKLQSKNPNGDSGIRA